MSNRPGIRSRTRISRLWMRLPNPDPAKFCGSDRIRIRKTDKQIYKEILEFYQRCATEPLYVTMKTYFFEYWRYLSRDSMRLLRSWLAGR